MLVDAAQMRRGRPAQGGPSVRGQDRVGRAAVARTGLPAHEAVVDHAVHETGEPARAEHDGVGEVAHAQPATRRPLQVQQHLVPREGQAPLLLELVTQHAEDPPVGAQELLPHLKPGAFQTSHLRVPL